MSKEVSIELNSEECDTLCCLLYEFVKDYPPDPFCWRMMSLYEKLTYTYNELEGK